MSKKVYMDSAAEREATEVGKKFMHSTDVVGDMSRAYGRDLSSVRIHADSDSDRKTAERGVDAFSTGKEVFFARAAFNKNDPASRGLLAHELSHSLQQGVGGEMGGMQHSAPMGAVQGGIKDWFENLFSHIKGGKKEAEEEKQSIAPMADEDIDAISLTTAPQYTQGMTNKEKFIFGARQNATDQYKLDNYSERAGLSDYMKDQYKGTDKMGLLENSNMVNASSSVYVQGLSYSRMLKNLDGGLGDGMSKEDIKELYDDLLSGGRMAEKHRLYEEYKGMLQRHINRKTTLEQEIAVLKKQRGKAAKAKLESKQKSLAFYEKQIAEDIPERIIKLNQSFGTFSQDEVDAANEKFDRGFLKLKGMYLKRLRFLKEKYGTYPTQMHPDDFMSKVGVDYFEDTAILQDTAQMMAGGGKYFDFENNPDDAEFKLLSDYYQDASSQINMYYGADQDQDTKEFNPSEDILDIAENRGYLHKLMENEAQIREMNGGNVTGFDRKQQIGYNKNVQNRYEQKGWLSRLLGRFKKR